MKQGDNTEHPNVQVEMIFEALNLLHPNGEVVELRILNTKKGTLSGYFDDFQALGNLAHQASGKVPAVYITLNPARKDLLARACNRIKTYVKTTTSDADIIRRRWFPIDVDPIRPKDISSTDEEHELALSKTYEIKSFLRSQGWPAPILGDSGNGGHLLYRIDLPNDNEASSLLRRCIEALDFLFSDEKVIIDRAVYNASRIWKLYGTMACKGENVPKRPHRLSNILEVPTDMETVSQEMIERIAAMLPETPKQEGGHGDYHPFNLQEWISKHGISVAWQKPWQGGTAYILEECPFNPEHNRKEVCIIQFGSGALSFTCRHNSCRGYDWHALRDKFEPGWRKRKNGNGFDKDEGVPKDNPHRSKHKKGSKRDQKRDDGMWGGNFRDTLQNFLSSLSENNQKVLFSDVLNCAKKFLYITLDTEFAFKMALSSVVANYFEDDPSCLLIVAPPSSAKTEIILSLGGSPFAWNVSSFTSKTLASGERNNPQASLLKRIGAFGLIFLKDLTTILELNSIDRGEIFAQLREIYDGSYYKTFGNGVVINWKGKVGIVGACTPIIEKYGESFKVLGERFLMCRISDVTTDNEELALNKALQDQSDSVNSLRDSLKALIAQFLQGCLNTALKQEIAFTQEHLEIIKTCAKFIAKTRAAVVRDTYSRDDILVKPFQEAPMRVAKQLKNLLRGLCVVDDVTTPKDIHFCYLFKVALDNIPSLRKEILEAVPIEGIFRADLIRKLGYHEKSRHFRRLMEDLTKLQILREEKEGNRVSVLPSEAVSDFYALFNKFRPENIEEFEGCPEKYPPSDSNGQPDNVDNPSETSSEDETELEHGEFCDCAECCPNVDPWERQ